MIDAPLTTEPSPTPSPDTAHGDRLARDTLEAWGISEEYRHRRSQALNALPPKRAGQANAYLKAHSYLEELEISLGYPAVFEIETTNRCAMTCNHCPRTTLMTRRVQDMDIDLFRIILDQTRPYAQNLFSPEQEPQIQFIHYGEPSAYRHYGEAIREAKRRGLKCVISSTSSALTPRAIQEAVDAQLDELWLIFDGMDDETFARIRGRGASFAKGMDNLDKLLQARDAVGSTLPRIIAVMIKHPYNRHQWGLFREVFGAKLGVTHELAHFSSFGGNVASINSLQAQVLDDPDEQAEAERVQRLNEQRCNYPWHSVSVLADGRVVPCCRDVDGALVLGDLKTQTLEEIWNGPAMRALRRQFLSGSRDNPLCRSCREGSLEIGVPDPEVHRRIESRVIALLEVPPAGDGGERGPLLRWLGLP